MQEMVSKSKVKDYFDYFKGHNPLFSDQNWNIKRLDTWLEELNTNEDHNTHDNDTDPVPSIDGNVVIRNNEGNVPIPKRYNVSNIDKIVRFENHIGQNNCWINCVLRALAIMVELVPNYTYQSGNPMINAFMKYVKNITYINNSTMLDVNE